MKYRKRPVVIEALHVLGGTTYAEITDFVGASVRQEANTILIGTLEGDMKVRVGDWIIRGVQGELYPCKPGIFEATYEAV